ncbi:hypothetical protein ACP6NG_09100 [Brevibacterium casei]|uniref:Uncharacterized protein n=1 Tax=Brevibacterium casei TaxID=33889 RepID=A0A7T2WPS8_9MICO|nr:hypothetical protein [Brevibacterium casei]QPS33455.1 hypothetical protein I6G59_16225 [Brevibacterium casei]
MSKLGITRPTAVVDLVTNLDLLADHQVAREELDRLNKLTPASERLNNPYSKEIRAQAKKVADLEKKMDDSTVCVKLRALKKAKWAEVVANHPPREDNDVDAALGFNTDTIADEAMPLSIVSAWEKDSGNKIDFTGDDWATESEEFTDAQFAEFAQTLLNLNRGSTTIPFSQIASAVNRT